MITMNADKQFISLCRWLKQSDNVKEMDIRFRNGPHIYEVRIKKNRWIRVHHPRLLSTDAVFIMYEWEAADTGENLTKKKIEAAQERADQLNQERKEFFNQLFMESNLSEESYEMIEGFLNEETQIPNYLNDEINLTEQDRRAAMQILADIL